MKRKIFSVLFALVLSFSLVTAVPVAAVGGKICMVDPDYTGDQGAEIDDMYWYSTLADIGTWGPGDDAIVYLAAGEHMGKIMPVGKVYDCLYLWGATNVRIIGAGADETIVWGQLSNIGTGTLVEGITFKGNLNEQEIPQDYRIHQGAFFYTGAAAVTFDHVIFDGFDYHIAGMPDGSTVDHCDFIAESFWGNWKAYRAITWASGAHGTVTNSIFASPWYVLSGMNFSSPSDIRNNDFNKWDLSSNPGGGRYDIPNNNGANITGNLYIDPELNEDYSLPDGSPLLTAGIAGTYIGAIAPPPSVIEVEIDIKPGSDPNSINLKSKGVVPVAVLTTDFDASTIDPETVVFAGAVPVRSTLEDVDSDGELDMLFHFKTQDLDLTEDSTGATLTGKTLDEVDITGTDTVNIVPKKGK